METNKPNLFKPIIVVVIIANILFVLWILYNGIKENFQGNNVEKASYVALMILLLLNAFLLRRKIKNDE